MVCMDSSCDEDSSIQSYDFPNSSTGCNSVLTDSILSDIGWNPKYGSFFELKLDLVSLMTAVSLNLKITNSTNLESAGIEIEGFDDLQSFFDARHPNMVNASITTYDHSDLNVEDNKFFHCNT